MAALSDYVTGTITLTNGEIEFTGTATGWLLAGFKEGDTIIDITGATEFMGVVATIDANGAGTLTKPWEGPTLSNVAYRMRYQPDGARVSAQARNLIEVLGSGNLQSIAALNGTGGNVGIMLDGEGSATTFPLPASGREMLENQGRLGSYGSTITDWFSIVQNGWYMGNDAANAPGPGWWIGEAIVHTPDYMIIEAVSFITTSEADTQSRRIVKKAGEWGGWHPTLKSRAEMDARFTRRLPGGTNEIFFDWDDGLRAQVDATPLGKVWSDFSAPYEWGTAGYQKLPNGLIYQWKRVSITGAAYVPWPISFPNASLYSNSSIVISGSDGETIGVSRLDGIELAGISCRVRLWDGATFVPGTAEVHLQGIGY